VEKLKKPPIIELFLGLAVEPSSDSQPWNHGTAQEFAVILNKREIQWEEAKILQSRDIQVRDMEQALPEIVGVKNVIERVQLFDKPRTKCIQYDQHQIIFNSLRVGPDYPGYDEVYAAAATNFNHYLKFFRPERIQQAVICYVDVINIPVGDATKIELSDYFKIVMDPQESVFGPMAEFEFRSSFSCDVDRGPLILTIRSMPRSAGQQDVQIVMEWQKICVEMDTLNMDTLKTRLDASQKHLSRCFRESFTEQGWLLFEPEDRMD